LFADVAHAQAKYFLIDIKIIKRPSRHQSNLLIIKNKHLKIHKYPWLQVFFVSKGIKVFMLFLENIKRPKKLRNKKKYFNVFPNKIHLKNKYYYNTKQALKQKSMAFCILSK
jgi:hypothetical protein